MTVNVQIPVQIGQKVFKICPQCNDKHVGTCQNCAWAGCVWNYCAIDVRVYYDGSYNDYKKQVIETKVTENNFVHIIDEWNVTYFETVDAAEQAIKEFEQIITIVDKHERVAKFEAWRAARKIQNELYDVNAD